MFPVIGQETLELVYDVTFAPTKQLRFVVYKVERVNSLPGAEYVKLHFTSIESYVNITTVISKSFKGNASGIINQIWKDHIGTGKPFDIEPTRNNVQFISPNWNPFFLINWLAGRSISTNGKMPAYMFYESMLGFNFVSLESKFTQKSVGTWKKQLPNASQSANSTDRDKESYNTSTILDYQVIEAFDFLDAQMHGMVGSELYIVDSLSNGYRKVTYDYLSEFGKTKHLNPQPLTVRDSSFGYRYETPGITRVVNNSSKAFASVTDTNRYEDWTLQRISFMQQLSGVRLKLDVAGNGVAGIGDVVDINIPLRATSETVEARLDPILSGKYLITAIHHTFNITSHKMTVEVSKESVMEVPHYTR